MLHNLVRATTGSDGTHQRTVTVLTSSQVLLHGLLVYALQQRILNIISDVIGYVNSDVIGSLINVNIISDVNLCDPN